MNYIFGKKKGTPLEVHLPEGWHQVPFNVGKKFTSNKEPMSDMDVLSLLSGVPVEEFKKSTDIQTIKYFTSTLTFLGSPPIGKHPEFPMDVMDHQLPWVSYADEFDLGKTTWGQVEDMIAQVHGMINHEDAEEILEVYLKISSIYLDPILHDDDYNYDRAMKSRDVLGDKVDYKTICNMGAFFLRRLDGLQSGSLRSFQKPHSKRRRWRLALSNLAQRLASMLP